MKAFNIKYFLLISILAIITSCKKEDTPKPLQLSTSTLTLDFEQSDKISITSGNGDYTIKIADESIAKGSLSENIIIVTGLKNGTTTLTITDQRGQSSSVSITVKPDPYGAIKSDATRRFEEKTGELSTVIKNTESDYYFYSDKGVMEIGANTKTKSKLGWSNPTEWSYFFVMWDGDFSIGSKTNAVLVTITKNGTPQSIAINKLSIIQAKDNLIWLIYNLEGKQGIIVQ